MHDDLLTLSPKPKTALDKTPFGKGGVVCFALMLMLHVLQNQEEALVTK